MENERTSNQISFFSNLLKQILRLLITELNPIKKMTSIKDYIIKIEQIFCYHNRDVIALVNTVIILKIIIAFRFLLFCNSNTTITFQWLWFDVITMFTEIRNANGLAFLIEICSVYMFKRFYFEYHDELIVIIKNVLFDNVTWNLFFLEPTYKNRPVIEWICHQCNLFLAQMPGMYLLLGKSVDVPINPLKKFVFYC